MGLEVSLSTEGRPVKDADKVGRLLLSFLLGLGLGLGLGLPPAFREPGQVVGMDEVVVPEDEGPARAGTLVDPPGMVQASAFVQAGLADMTFKGHFLLSTNMYLCTNNKT